MAGTDTFSFERYERRGNVVTGGWVVLHPPGVYVHEYRITLGDDGLPMHYTMKYGERSPTRRRAWTPSSSTTGATP